MSFFDEGDEPTRVRVARPRARGAPATGRAPARGAARRPDRQTARVRQAVGLGVAHRCSLIVLVLGVKGCLDEPQGERAQGLQPQRHRGHHRLRPAVGKPFFEPARPTARADPGPAGAGQPAAPRRRGRRQARQGLRRARRHEGRPAQPRARAQPARRGPDARSPTRSRAALGRGQAAEDAINQIAGQMQAFLASDVVYSQRVAPLHQGGARQQRRQRPADRRQPLPARRLVAGAGRPSPRASAAARRRLGTGSWPAAPGLHGHGLSARASATSTLQPGAGVVNRVAVVGQPRRSP